MRIRWRNLELPTHVAGNKETLSDEYGEFTIEPFERGFGRTIGNSLRRVLLSSIEGSAITSIKIEGVDHEFSIVPGVIEDVADIILNIKKLRLRLLGDNSAKMYIDVEKKGVVTGADIEANSDVEIVNKDLVIATLAEKVSFQMELEARRGRGYVSAEENLKEPQEIGVIPIASIFSPVLYVRYDIENTRVGKMTNYDKLILQIKTDGTLSPEMALVEAAKILRKHLNPFIHYFELGEELKEGIQEEEIDIEDKNDQEIEEKLNYSIDVLDLSVRASNCLETEDLRTIGDLVTKNETDLLKIRNFGKTSLKEIKEKLTELGLSLGMQVDK